MWAPTPLMIILGLFLLYLAATGTAFGSIGWLVRWLGGATMTEAALTFSAVLVFWSLVIFGAGGTTAINIIALAAATLVVAAAVVLVGSFMVRRRAARS